jgi:hypothetical protein
VGSFVAAFFILYSFPLLYADKYWLFKCVIVLEEYLGEIRTNHARSHSYKRDSCEFKWCAAAFGKFMIFFQPLINLAAKVKGKNIKKWQCHTELIYHIAIYLTYCLCSFSLQVVACS